MINTPYASNITKEELAQLPLGGYEGEIILITDAKDIPACIDEVSQYSYVGFDTETKPVFKKGEYNFVSLIQIGIPEKVFLIRINQTGITDELVTFLSNKNIEKLGIAQGRDIVDLRRLREFKHGGFVNLDAEVSKIGIESNGLRKLAGIIMNIKVSKSAQISNWEADELSEKQQRYAATDAWVCLEMYKKVMPYLGDMPRSYLK